MIGCFLVKPWMDWWMEQNFRSVFKNICAAFANAAAAVTGKNNGFPILDILGYLKNTHKNPKFGRVRQIPIWELGWEFSDWDLSHFSTLKYPKLGIRFFFLCVQSRSLNSHYLYLSVLKLISLKHNIDCFIASRCLFKFRTEQNRTDMFIWSHIDYFQMSKKYK